MNKLTLLAAGISLVMVSGCANDHLYYQDKCITCMNNPLTGEPVNYDPDALPDGALAGSSSATVSQTADGYPPRLSLPGVSERQELSMIYLGDVDTASALLKNAFGYMTREEAIARHGNMAGGMMFSGDHSYSAVPGSFYSMTGPYSGGSLTTRVSKTPAGADVLFTFSVTRNYQGPSIESVMQRVQSVADGALR